MKVALLGLLQSGKSTLLSAISTKPVPPAGSTAIDEAIVPVPDDRLDWLAAHYKRPKAVHATVDCLDVPGFNLADDHGRAATRRFINQIRTVEMLVLILRAFENPDVPPYGGKVDPARDVSDLQTELLLSDLELVTTRLERLEKQVHKPTDTQAHDKAELALHQKLQAAIEAEKPIRSAIQSDAEIDMIKPLGLLTLKPIAVVVNTGEDQLGRQFDLSGRVDPSVPVICLCARIEHELAQLDDKSRPEFMADLGIAEPAVNSFVRGCYQALGLISFLTVGSDEVRAWPVKKGTIALDAAGKVHSDIRRGFIRAETMAFADLKELGDDKAVKAAGKARLEGKQYVVQDGDIINFRFNV